MKLADFFVELGLEGDNAFLKGMRAVDSTIKGVTVATGALIAATAGAFYGMSRLTQSASKTGAEYKKFQSLTGVNVDTLQKWETAARKASVSEESLRSSIIGVQDAITQMQLGGGAPKGLVFLQELEGFDPTRMEDAFYMLSQIQRLSQKLSPQMMREFAGSFGVDADMLSAMRQNAFNPEAMRGGATYTRKELETLKTMSGQWNKILNDMEVGANKFAAQFGDDFVNLVDNIMNKFNELVDKFNGLSESKELVDGLKVGFEALYKVIEMLFDLTVKFLESDFFRKGMRGISAISSAVSNTLSGKSGGIKDMVASLITGHDLSKRIVGPARPSTSTSSSTVTDSSNHNYNITIQESSDGRETATQLQNVLNRTYKARAGALSE